ncbi:MAG: TauD/TfdA family dioxygenase [Pseudomonadota bacterium]|nr:TauD/TfdA family dioxygenase [Pseudomonadota bacterium]
MPIQSLELRARALKIGWSDGSQSDYPYLFLRDNDPAGFHPQTRERQFDLLAVSPDTTAKSAVVEGDAVAIEWTRDTPRRSLIPTAWLAAHRPGTRNGDPADVAAVTWGAEFARAIPRVKAADILGDDAAFLDWLLQTKRYGLALITGLTDDEDAGVRLGERIGFLRRTNFGVTFRVETRPDPNNLAYTSHSLPLHTDLPNQELPPGYQFLHCVRNDALGGESIFADSFRIAERVRAADADAFRLLSQTPVPYRFHDDEVDIRVHRPLISLDERGRVFDVRYSAHLLDAFDMPAEIMADYYQAFRIFMAETRNPENVIEFKMRRGEMVVFDNRRALHGRTGFDPMTGHRLLKGFYVDRGEFDSRIRKLAARR